MGFVENLILFLTV